MLMIETFKQLQQEVPVEKLNKSWQKAWIVTKISHQLKKIAYIIPSHVRHKGNSPADYLANWGCRRGEKQLDAGVEELHQQEDMEQLLQMIEQDRAQSKHQENSS